MPENKLPFQSFHQTIQKRFEEIVAMFPGRVAIDFGEVTITYEELNRVANQLAHKIIDRTGENKNHIAIFLENSPMQIIAILGVLKAGRAYVALDINFPERYNLQITRDAQCKFIITDKSNLEKARSFADDQYLIMAEEDKYYPDTNPTQPIDPQDPAVLFYTSGSTGQPKGAIHSHVSMVHLSKRFSNLADLHIDNRFAYYLSVGFSAHILPVLGALHHGGTLCMFNKGLQDLEGFKGWLNNKEITLAMMIPSFTRYFRAIFSKNEKLKFLKTLFVGGETLYRNDVEKLRNILSDNGVIINIYASSETYLSRAFKIKNDTFIQGNIVPVGYPIEDIEISIHDEHGKTVEHDEIGEFYISSPYMMDGYWKRPELNAKVLQTSPEYPGKKVFKSSDIGYYKSNDLLVCVGRKDSVVKLRGYRIDMGEIENVLLESTEVKEAASVVKKDRNDKEQIIAYITPSVKQPDIELLKAMTIRMLPSYMVPHLIIELESLPKNEIGKIDYKALPEPIWNFIDAEREIVKAGNETESRLVQIFEKALRIKPLGITDNLLKMGADSLSLFVAFNEVQKLAGKKFDIDQIMENHTIKDIAKHLDELS